jgi:hypothetical protein
MSRKRKHIRYTAGTHRHAAAHSSIEEHTVARQLSTQQLTQLCTQTCVKQHIAQTPPSHAPMDMPSLSCARGEEAFFVLSVTTNLGPPSARGAPKPYAYSGERGGGGGLLGCVCEGT